VENLENQKRFGEHKMTQDILKKINIALVGCGRISKNHIKAIILNYSKIEFVAICDNDLERLNNACDFAEDFLKENSLKDFNPLKFDNYLDLIESHKEKKITIDLIVLATPSGLHSEQVILAAESGINVCTEKPMATNWEDGVKMLSACKKANVKLFVVKQNRFNKTIELLKKQIDSNRFGKIALVTVNVFWHRPQSYYDLDAWRGTIEMDGGALMNQSSHYVDLIDWLFGPLEKVSALTATIKRDIEAEDTAVLQFKCGSGILGTMAVTMLTYPQNLEGSITVLGEKGTVRIGGKAVNKIEHWLFEDESPDDLIVEKASYETTSVYGFGHPAYYKNMLEVLQEDKPPICDGDEGLKSLEILEAAYRSSRLNVPISLPLNKVN
tara:strand:+ start:17408 stop:18556 length:1149 start_codon:yes stop_codon:yes gene_type:complete